MPPPAGTSAAHPTSWSVAPGATVFPASPPAAAGTACCWEDCCATAGAGAGCWLRGPGPETSVLPPPAAHLGAAVAGTGSDAGLGRRFGCDSCLPQGPGGTGSGGAGGGGSSGGGGGAASASAAAAAGCCAQLGAAHRAGARARTLESAAGEVPACSATAACGETTSIPCDTAVPCGTAVSTVSSSRAAASASALAISLKGFW